MKKKLLVVILFCLCITGMALARQAREVINIDLNVDGDANAFPGKAAYDTNNALYSDGINTWLVYDACELSISPVIGKAYGSPRSAHLGNSNEPCNPAIYARQIWLGENNRTRYTGYRDTNYPSPGLMNDGFLRVSGEPNLWFWGKDAYQGQFDIYAYGNQSQTIKLGIWDANSLGFIVTTRTLTGGIADGTFTENGNYAKFTDVNVIDNVSVTKTLYVDGVVIGSRGTAAPLSYPVTYGVDSRYLGVGADGNLPMPKDSGLRGQIDEFAVFRSALTAAQISAHYNGGSGSQAAVSGNGPRLYLKFDTDGSSNNGDSVADAGADSSYTTSTYYSNGTGGGACNLVAGKINNAVSFTQGTDSNNACVRVFDGESKLMYPNMTIECWVKTTQNDGNRPKIFNHNPNGGQFNAYGASLIAGTDDSNTGIGMIGAGNTNNLGNLEAVAGAILNDGDWHHVAVVYTQITSSSFISYSRKLSGLQFVSTKKAIAINPADPNTTLIEVGRYDVAGERTGRTDQITTVLYGPSLINNRRFASRVERREFMEYDIDVTEATKGKYSVTADVVPGNDAAVIIRFDLDDVNLGTTSRIVGSDNNGPTDAIEVNLVPGSHTFRWIHPGYDSSSTAYTINDINFVFITADEVNYPGIVNCAGVARFGRLYEGDLNKDCKVDRKDLDVFTDWWLECDDPNWRNCK